MAEFTAFVETHSFWDTEDDGFDTYDDVELEVVFWTGERRRSA